MSINGKTKKFLYNIILALATLIVTYLFWTDTLLLLTMLVMISFLMLMMELNKASVLLFIIGLIFGPLAEALVIYGGVWNYTSSHILGVPIWLPLVWGNAALFFKRTISFLEN